MSTALPNLRAFASLVNGLPTCTFPPTAYTRNILSMLVKNTVTSSVNVYIGSLGSTPVASNNVGSNNTLRGPIRIPAGQPFFVQWSVAGSPVSGATANVQLEEVDNPLDSVGGDGAVWDTTAFNSFTVPNTAGPNDPAISLVTGADIPAALVAFYAIEPATLYAVIIDRADASNYTYDGLIVDSFGDPSRVVGRVDTGVVSEIYRIGMGSNAMLFGARTPKPIVAFNGILVRLTNGSAPWGGFDIGLGNTFSIDSISAGRGPRGFGAINFVTGWYGGVHAELGRVSNVLFYEDRVYKIEVEADVENDTANNQAEFRLWLNAIGGTSIRFGSSHPMAAVAGIGTTCKCSQFVYASGSDKTYDVVWGMNALIAGNVRVAGSNDRLAYLQITDVGDVANFPNALAI